MELRQQALLRPKQPPKPPPSEKGFALTFLVLVLAVYWVLIPIWPVLGSELLGDVDTDAIRGMWGFDHIRRSMIPPNTPLWSDNINFPDGVVALTLPWTTGILLSPIGFLFGPVVAWNIGLALILLSLGLSTAWLLRQLTGKWSIGCAAAGLVMTQPMLLHSIADGTPEHLSMWGVPLLLGASWKAFRISSPRWGLLAGLFALLVALDSPYHAIYASLTGIIVLPWAFLRKWNIEERLDFIWTIGSLLALCLLGAIFVISVYSLFPLGESSTQEYIDLWKMNAADLRVWWQHDYETSVIRDVSLAPTTIPMPLLWLSIVLIMIGLPRSVPWALAGVLMLNLSLGLNENLPVHLGYWVGKNMGKTLGENALTLNAYLYAFPGLGEIRFPQRWLVPAALCFAVGSGFGLEKLYRQKWINKVNFPISILLVMVSTFICLRSSRIDLKFPKQELPVIEFANYLADQPGRGGLVMLPAMRPPPPSGKRSDLPVFANLGDSLSSADVQYFQTIHGKPIYDKPSLKTLYAFEGSEYIFRLLREWDDLAHPMVTGTPIPASAYDERFTKRRQIGLKQLLDAGLEWIVLDLGAYNEEALAIFNKQVDPYVAERLTFAEGDGVLVLRLTKP